MEFDEGAGALLHRLATSAQPIVNMRHPMDSANVKVPEHAEDDGVAASAPVRPLRTA